MDPFNDPSFQQQPAASWPYDLMQQYQPVQQPSPHQQNQASPQFITPMPYMQQPVSQPFPAPQASSINIPETLGPDFIPLGLFSQMQGQVPQQHAQQQQQQQAQQPPAVDANGQPIKVRKKPGRKPNPASPALRKAQNRAAQRAFRERKERHLRELENTIRTLREQRANAVKELNETKVKLDSYKAENWYLKGVMLTLQFVCLHHNIQIPNHSPYLTEEALSEMARTSPHAIEAYVNAYTRNNIDLKPTMASQFANLTRNTGDEKSDAENVAQQGGDDDMDEDMIGREGGEGGDYNAEREKSEPRHTSPSGHSIRGESVDTAASMEGAPTPGTHSEMMSVKQEENDDDLLHHRPEHTTSSSSPSNEPSMSSLGAIQRIRLQLRIQSTLTSFGNTNIRLQPTLLQLAIPHDPRIDLIPTAHMRDRMIIFRDFMDYDRCFSMLLNGAVYHGGDPTMSESWELPAEFFAEFWYLVINYDYKRTNKWRLMKGLPKVESAVKEAENTVARTSEEQGSAGKEHGHPSSYSGYNDNNGNHNQASDWSDDIFGQFIETMPSLQPVQSTTSPTSQTSTSDSMTHPLYERLLSSPPELREPIRSPSLGNIMDLMTTLSTENKDRQ